MNKLILTAVLFVAASIAMAQDTMKLTVTVNNASNDNGKMVFGLYTQDQFMKTAPEMEANVEIKDGVAVAVFEGVAPGKYAVIVLHDMNGNKQMDFDTSGMPAEQYGSSNNAMSMGPPQFSDASFDLSEDTNMIIRL